MQPEIMVWARPLQSLSHQQVDHLKVREFLYGLSLCMYVISFNMVRYVAASHITG